MRAKVSTAHARIYPTAFHVGDANSAVTHVVHTDLLARAERLPWHDVVTIARLRDLARFLRQGPPALRVFVDVVWNSEDAWTALLKADFRWLDSYQDTRGPSRDWLQEARAAPRAFLAAIGTATEKARRHWKDHYHMLQWQRGIA